ncbi:MAG TPA: formylglycine-generating enzyme family protein [Candidatus Saccharimonadales bacterium]|nr:formylglycine-generating enzyme family protein [Candidatus Saccharimonadales bacterium]
MEFVLIAPGEFTMGTPADEPDREAQEVQHRVRLTKAFYLGRYEVTQDQWRTVMGSNPSHFSGCGGSCPVESVSFLDIGEFISKLEALAGGRFRLPTEAEWEYACRAGTTTPFAFGTELTEKEANIQEEPTAPGDRADLQGTVPVGSYAPNAWGLFDMHGNVWEWCEDRHCPYGTGAQVDPLGSCDSGVRIIRGGSWYYGADSARCGLRYTHHDEDSGPSLGFRLVREAPAGGQ